MSEYEYEIDRKAVKELKKFPKADQKNSILRDKKKPFKKRLFLIDFSST